MKNTFTTQDKPLPEDKEAQAELETLINSLELRSEKGLDDSPFRGKLSGSVYECKENPMGITKFSFVFTDKTKGEFRYTNAQGDKVIPFGVNHNVFGKFPQLGYANDRGAVPTTDGFMYDDAVSLGWIEEKKLILSVQVIDRYFGNMSAAFAFKDGYVQATFSKTAEHFMSEYAGALFGVKSDMSLVD